VPQHRVFTDEGLVELCRLREGTGIVTVDGISPVHAIKATHEEGKKQVVWVPRGNLYWSNGILSHNFKR
jgi:hypothetical protein